VLEVGDTDTVIAGTVTVAEAVFVESTSDVAVTATLRSLAGGLAGALYVANVPLGVDVGETEPQGAAEQETLHVTF
jgi:hypothetical protein